MEEEGTLSIAASWGEGSFPTEMEEGEEPTLSPEAEPSSEVASEASLPQLSCSMSALMGHDVTFLQVPWATQTEPCRSVFQTQAVAPGPQSFPPHPDFMEEVRSSWVQLASVPSVLKQAVRFASLEGTEKLGLAGFPPVAAIQGYLSLFQHFGGRLLFQGTRVMAFYSTEIREKQVNICDSLRYELLSGQLSSEANIYTDGGSETNISDAMKAQLGSEVNNIYTDASSEHHQLRLVWEITDVSPFDS
ncbi:UNVERIFIED_CONTAM: hypothetical protein FKN15_037834 [Acipenser sinensis]